MYFEHEFDIAHIWPATLINLTSFVKLSLQNCTVRENINLSLEKYLKYINYLTIAILFFFFFDLSSNDSPRFDSICEEKFDSYTFLNELHFVIIKIPHDNFRNARVVKNLKIGKRNPEIHFPY